MAIEIDIETRIETQIKQNHRTGKSKLGIEKFLSLECSPELLPDNIRLAACKPSEWLDLLDI